MALRVAAVPLAVGGAAAGGLSGVMTVFGLGLLAGGVGALLLVLGTGRAERRARVPVARVPVTSAGRVGVARPDRSWRDLDLDTGRRGPDRPWPVDGLSVDGLSVDGLSVDGPADAGGCRPSDGPHDRSRG